MASWIMVSSRWVLGLSTGRRPVSAITAMSRATRAKALTGLTIEAG